LSQRDACLLPADRLLHRYPAAVLADGSVGALLHGRKIREIEAGLYRTNEEKDAGLADFSNLEEGQRLRLYDGRNCFLGLGEVTPEMEIAPLRLVTGW